MKLELKLMNNGEIYTKKHNFEKYNVIRQKFLKYDVNKFIYEPHSYGIYIKPDDNFIELIKELNQVIIHKINLP